ncbi:unnamed protein product [Didymodactylos carnosus]|uniref:Uncharacterized protein n=1 Tax=Didymodactylos carnosus TaxID=1234261 RepID=A0A814TPP1_9BILA|nr:unnamed protein product [Didymodactylos carnosus]CAF1575246.1 unnamed protein product [Didymodactylos carnosus]CAF3928206.1 unnamed protein product [Didymodactylos carnosus]CAF4371686.1 unnamed protein product [Didymodactylos carnosus]
MNTTRLLTFVTLGLVSLTLIFAITGIASTSWLKISLKPLSSFELGLFKRCVIDTVCINDHQTTSAILSIFGLLFIILGFTSLLSLILFTSTFKPIFYLVPIFLLFLAALFIICGVIAFWPNLVEKSIKQYFIVARSSLAELEMPIPEEYRNIVNDILTNFKIKNGYSQNLMIITYVFLYIGSLMTAFAAGGIILSGSAYLNFNT